MRKAVALLLAVIVIGCAKSTPDDDGVFSGTLSKDYVRELRGFVENRDGILQKSGVAKADFVSWSTQAAVNLPKSARQSLRDVRLAVEMPTSSTLLQKIIPLDDVATYINNTYGGTVGGFATVAADTKNLTSMSEVYWGLRLDYDGTKFREAGAGYAVIRYYSEATQKLIIPFCAEMGGTYNSVPPNTGGGFTSSTLGEGGIVEYTFTAYSAPKDGAELYEVTPAGREILRSVYRTNKGWVTSEIGSLSPNKSLGTTIRNGVFADTKSGKIFVTTYAQYRGNIYIVRGLVNEQYHLTTMVPYANTRLQVVEKGVYGLEVPMSEVEKIWENIENIN